MKTDTLAKVITIELLVGLIIVITMGFLHVTKDVIEYTMTMYMILMVATVILFSIK